MKILTNLKKLSKFGLFSEIRKHEVEIVSNRRIVCYGECFFRFCTHRPSRSEIFLEGKELRYINFFKIFLYKFYRTINVNTSIIESVSIFKISLITKTKRRFEWSWHKVLVGEPAGGIK